jgi:DNA adenine methylase
MRNRHLSEVKRKTTPFVKWAGGKQALLPTLVEAFPSSFDRFFEPFVGGGSVVLGVAPNRGVINDANRWLMDTYEAVRRGPSELTREIDRLENTREEYLRIRSIHPDSIGPVVKRAAHFIYLNKTCFRGLFRVNRRGYFNVPWGAYERRIYDPEILTAAASVLEDIEVRSCDFELAVADVTPDDFVYFDPPYYKLGGYSDFNRYTADQFRGKDHIRLAALCRELDAKGVRWAVSNSKTEFVTELYSGFRFREVQARREINLNSSQRDIAELLISNF